MAKQSVRNAFGDLALLLWLALLCSGAMASATTDLPNAGTSLAELENLALVAAPSVQLAQAEQDVAAHRNSTARASQGARIFGGTGISTAREIASICCSPPDSWPPPWSLRSARRGNVA